MQAIDQQDRHLFLEGLFQVSGDAFIVTDEMGTILMVNKAALDLFGYTEEEMVGEHFAMLSPVELSFDENPSIIDRLWQDQFVENYETVYKKKDGSKLTVEVNVGLLYDARGDARGAASSIRDITRRKQDELMLKKKDQDLEAGNRQLEEINTALRVLLQKRDEDKRTMEDNIVANMQRLVMPYFDRMKQTCKGCSQKSYVEILESHVLDILSPFIQALSKKEYKLSPREIVVANLVKSGMTTKEIAHHMNVSARTVEVYRRNIRKKLSLQNKKANLQSYLSSQS
ncbi:MAG: PAS domain S-box protein [Deltaproteobacteria bacterium]|nr:PAS domain S-box protein [Deltaproteobacteria bacterium]